MNCRRFQDQLFEYVEGSLSASARAASDEHLAGCPACRDALRREEAWSQTLSCRLGQQAARLKLPPEIQRDMVAAMCQEPAPSPLTEFVRGWGMRFAAPLTVSAAALVLCTALLMNRSPGPTKPVAGSAPRSSRDVPATVSVELASRVQVCQFRCEGDTVIDTLSLQLVGTSITLHPLRD